MRRTFLLAVLALSLTPAIRADESTALTRDEVTAIKRKLQAIETALGAPPVGFERADENFNLPTEFSPANTERKTYNPINGGVTLKFDGGSARLGQQATTQAQDLQKRMMAAMQAGNYDEVAKIQQQIGQQVGATQSAAIDAGAKGTIHIGVTLNEGGGQGIDPDNILFEKPGVLALKVPQPGNPGDSHVTVYFDPVGLAASKAATVTIRNDATPRRTAVLNAAIDLTGPAAPTEAWARKIATGPVLAQLDR